MISINSTKKGGKAMLARCWLTTLCLVAIWGGTSFAVPTITEVPSSISHGQTFIVRGSGFGTKSISGPLVWDNFENGTAGSNIPGQAPVVENMSGTWTWSSTDGDPPTYSTEVLRPGVSTMSSLHNYFEGLYGNAGLSVGNVPFMQTWYISFWWYFDRLNSIWSRNTKPFVVDGSVGGLPFAYIGFGQVGVDPGLRSNIYDTGISNNKIAWGGTTLDSIEEEWVRIEAVLRQSTPNTADGELSVWIHRPYSTNPSIKYDLNKNPTATRGTNNFWSLLKISSYSSLDGGASQRAFVDDFYFDSTQARIELGNSDSWSTCTKRELQIPSLWLEKEITFTVNQGSFVEGEPVYLYVVDASGNVSQGVQVSFGEEGAIPPIDAAPILAFTLPTTGTSYTAEAPSTDPQIFTIAGTSTDDNLVTSVSYVTDKGGTGVANTTDGFATWDFQISVNNDETVISTVTATDNVGNETSKTMSITSTAPSGWVPSTAGWSANVQTGDNAWKDSGVAYCARLLVQGNYITTSGSQIILGFQGRSSGDYSIHSVSIAERDINGAEGDVIDNTWKQVTFDGGAWSSNITVPAGMEKLSDPVQIDFKAGSDYYVTFQMASPTVYLYPPTGYSELYFTSADHTKDVDWSGNGHNVTQDYHALSNIYVIGTDSPVAPPTAPSLGM